MEFYKSTRIYTEKGLVSGFIGVENGKIACIVEGESCGGDYEDFGDLRIIPGIIDTHNHGAVGYGFDSMSSMDEFGECLLGEAANGVTGIFTTIHKVGQYALCADAAEQVTRGARVLGIHSEGPWGTRVGEKGDPKNTYYEEVSLERAQQMIDESRGYLKIVSVAPEKEGALEAIRYLTERGIVCSSYHTNANYKECKAGIEAGVRNATHLGNVMTGLHHRDVGTFGASLLDDRVYCEQICDGLHVCLEMLQIVMKVKPHDHILMVSDNGAYLGAPVGDYRGSAENQNNDRKTIHVTPEGFVLSDSGRLSGSSKPVLYGIGQLVEKNGMDIEDVLKMSSYYVAKRYELEGRGSINPGNYADFVVITDDYKARATFVEGRKVWDCERDQQPFNPEFLKQFRIEA